MRYRKHASGLLLPEDQPRPLQPLCMGAPQQALLMASGAAATDPFWSSVIFLYNHSATAVDSSTVGRGISTVANASISTTGPFVAGMASMLSIDDTGGFNCGDAADIRLTGGVFTIEWILKPSVIQGVTQYVANKYDAASTGNGWYAYVAATTGLFNFATRSGFVDRFHLTSTSAMSTAAYQHVAICVNGTTANGCTLWYNGALQHTQTASGLPGSETQAMRILDEPASSGSQNMRGNVAAMRITTAIRYTGAFTPPTGVWPTS